MGKFFIPNQFKKIYKEYSHKTFSLLDVGCGNHSAQKAKQWFQNCKYYGIDKACCNNDNLDFSLMEKYYEIDLENEIEKLDNIPNNYFDVIICSHVIEHIPNGIEVINRLTKKIKVFGRIYIEFPSVKSLSLPSMQDTLHFCDDPTHVRIYSIQELANELLKNNFGIIKAATRRDLKRIIFTPLVLILDWWKTRRLVAYGLWDILGFADYIYAEKRNS
ncbi:MAG: class I SAM-dependent methyltransferase [Ignavibacteriales bacterium]|nr:class I SAM-dependent methyltransferase [Ignavibacteriales bacterium]